MGKVCGPQLKEDKMSNFFENFILEIQMFGFAEAKLLNGCYCCNWANYIKLLPWTFCSVLSVVAHPSVMIKFLCLFVLLCVSVCRLTDFVIAYRRR